MFLFLILTLIGHSQVDFRIHIDKKKIGYFDPIEMNITFSYSGPDTLFYSVFGKRFRKTSDSTRELTSRPILQYRRIDSTEWNTLKWSGYARFEDDDYVSGYGSNYKVKSKFFSDLKTRLYYFPVDSDNHFVFKKPGKYLCRLFVHSFYSDSIGIVSSVDTVLVKRYRRRDRKVIKKLLNMEKPRFVFSYLTHSSYGLSSSSEKNDFFPSFAKEILSWKSKSKYADLAKWHVVAVLTTRRALFTDDGYTFSELRDMQLDILEKTKNPEVFRGLREYVMSMESAVYDERFFKQQFERNLKFLRYLEKNR